MLIPNKLNFSVCQLWKTDSFGDCFLVEVAKISINVYFETCTQSTRRDQSSLWNSPLLHCIVDLVVVFVRIVEISGWLFDTFCPIQLWGREMSMKQFLNSSAAMVRNNAKSSLLYSFGVLKKTSKTSRPCYNNNLRIQLTKHVVFVS